MGTRTCKKDGDQRRALWWPELLGQTCLLKPQVLGLHIYIYISSVQSLSRVCLFVTPWTAARQASLSITNSWSLLKLMSVKSVMPSHHLILCRPLLLPSIFLSIWSFPMSQLECIYIYLILHQIAHKTLRSYCKAKTEVKIKINLTEKVPSAQQAFPDPGKINLSFTP